MNYDRRIDILQPVTTTDSYGQPVESFELLKAVWANVNHKGGREGFYARQVVATGEVVFKIRYTTGITEKMLINHDSKTYDIAAIAETGRRNGLEITAVARDNKIVS